MFTKTLKLTIFIFIFFIASCGVKKSWEKSGNYTSDKNLASTYIWKKGKQYIALVATIPVRGRNKSKTIHPIKVSKETIIVSFSKLKYKISYTDGTKSRLKPVFTEGNIELLSNKIPEALRKANKNQDVLFEVFQLRKKFGFIPSTIDTTAGYLFVEKGRINIIFEKINEDYKGYDYDEPRKLTASASSGIYGGKNPVSKGWAILTPKSWKSY